MAALLFWLFAAILVAASHAALERVSIAAGALAELLAIVGAAFGYMRFAARDATVDHAIGVGLAWLLLAVLSEIALGGDALVGSPDRPLIRNLFLFVWIFSPALFASRRGRP